MVLFESLPAEMVKVAVSLLRAKTPMRKTQGAPTGEPSRGRQKLTSVWLMTSWYSPVHGCSCHTLLKWPGMKFG